MNDRFFELVMQAVETFRQLDKSEIRSEDLAYLDGVAEVLLALEVHNHETWEKRQTLLELIHTIQN